MPLHHIVPQMLLRRFAAEGKRVRALSRDGKRSVTMNVRRAAAESGLYRLQLAPPFDQEFPPETVEAHLAYFEGRAAPIIDDLVNDRFDMSDDSRFYLTLFVALQYARGWGFREDLSQLMTVQARQYLEMNMKNSDIERQLLDAGRSADSSEVHRFRRAVLESDWKVVGNTSSYTQAMLQMAFNYVHPWLFLHRRIRVLRFERPCLLISDEPVGLWARPNRDASTHSLGIRTADAIWLPLDRTHSLVLLRRGSEGITEGKIRRAMTINGVVAAQANRWIFQHPDDPPFDIGSLPKPEMWIEDIQSVTRDGSEIRVQGQVVRRSPSD